MEYKEHNTQSDLYETAIAIVGMSGRFPGAASVQEFWRNLAGGVCSIHSFDDVDLRRNGFDTSLTDEKTWVRAGTLLDGVANFDAAFFGYVPREAETIDPQHRLMLECSWNALEDAGYSVEEYTGRIGIFTGSGPPSYKSRHLLVHPDVMASSGELQISIGNDKDSLASTVSYKLNLKGPSVSVQTFCSTSLVSVHLACQSLLTYECDLALAGGVAVQVPQGCGYEYQEGGILSPDGHCRTFDARASGSVMGSGVGLVVLKRLDEALRDGDQVCAVIRGSAVNNDGGVRAGYTAPSVDGQAEVIAEALSHAGVEAETIGYIEAHGTATPLGDAVELAAMIKAFRGRTERKGYCAIGSVKPNVGHLDRAAGITGLIKTVQALRHKQLPPQIDYEQPNPDVDLASSPFYVNTELREWPREDTPRRAGVSSFGLGGTNAHVVLEEAPEAKASSSAQSWELLVVSAKTPAALERTTRRLADKLAAEPGTNLGDVAYTLQVGRCAFNHRRIAVCRDTTDAASVLSSSDPQRVFTMEQVRRGRPVAFMFPGLGDQYTGMARELYQSEPAFREAVDECSAIVQHHLGIDLRTGLGFGIAQPAVSHGQWVVELPALFTVEYALGQLLISWGIRPQAVIGYSLGEYVAAVFGGILSLEESLRLCCKIERILEAAPPGEMLAVAASAEEIQPLLGGAELAAVNASRFCVVSGSPADIRGVELALAQRAVASRRLTAHHAFHSRPFAEATQEIAELAVNVADGDSAIQVFSSAVGGLLRAEHVADSRFWSRPVHDRVRFLQAGHDILRDEELALIELGPGPTLTSFLRQDPRCGSERVIVSILPHPETGRLEQASLLEGVGKLWLAGVSVNWEAAHSGCRKRISLPPYPFEQQRHWLDARQGTWEFKTAVVDDILSLGKDKDISTWTYQPAWIRAPLPVPIDWTLLKRKAPWLIFASDNSIADGLVASLRAQGCQTIQVVSGDTSAQLSPTEYEVRIADTDGWSALLGSLDQSPKTVVHLGAVLAHVSPNVDDLLERGFYSVLALAQAIERQLPGDDIELWSVSTNAVVVSREDRVAPAAATLLGTARVISQELPNVRCAHIDATPGFDVLRDKAFTDQLLRNLTVAPPEQPVALRDDGRWLRRDEPLWMEPPLEGSVILRNRGVYILTGGFGAVAGVVASYLANKLSARMVLLARTVPPSRDSWSDWLAENSPDDPTSRLILRVQELEAMGADVWFAAVDIADEARMRAVLDEARTHFGEIHGVFHMAGCSDSESFQTIRNMTQTACEQHFGAKLRAVLVLDKVLPEEHLDFVVVFSSLAAILGGLGFVAYAAANAAMDAFVSVPRRPGRAPWVAIDWDTWQVRDRPHGDLGRTIAELEMSPREAIALLERILIYLPSQVIVSTGNLEHRFRQWVSKSDASNERQTYPRPELSTTYEAPGSDLEARLCDIWQHVLGLERVGVYDNFLDLGGHSLLAVQLIGRVRKIFRVDIPLTALFDAPMVRQFADVVEQRALEDIEALSEEEVAHLNAGVGIEGEGRSA